MRREYYTSDGSFVLLDDGCHAVAPDVPERLFACTSGQSDMGARLETGEMLRLAEWLLTQALTDTETGLVLHALHMTATWDQVQRDTWEASPDDGAYEDRRDAESRWS